MKQFLINYFFFCFFFFSFFASGFIDSQDGFQYLAIARRMYYDKTFEMPIESYPDDNLHMSVMDASDGKLYSPTGLGYSLSLLPAVFLEDMFLRISGTEHITAFPLQNDWPVLLFASMTNAFWVALFIVTIYSYLREMTVKHTDALLLSFLFAIGTNIFVHSKHTFAQMMFVSTMTVSFFCIKKFVTSQKKIFLILSGLSFGLVLISYNPTYLLLLPSLGLYYLFLVNFKFRLKYIFSLLEHMFWAGIGLAPFFLLYIWFNFVRFGGGANTGYTSAQPMFPPAYVIFEGIWGLLLSPGKSIFLFTPILLVLVLFWHKFKRKFLPELIAALLLFFVYLWNMGTLLGDVDYLVWHGDSSWGPRYMLPVLPLFFIVIATIYTNLTKKQKLFVFYPLIFLGFYINLLSVVFPYQIRFAGLQTDAFFNGRNFNVYEYGNEIPRYSPIFKLSKTLVKRIKNIPETYNHGKYALRLMDGFDYPFDLGWSVWRGIKPKSVIKFTDPDSSISLLSLQIKNHQMDPESTQSAYVKVKLNGEMLTSEPVQIPIESEKELQFDVTNYELSSGDNTLELISSFESSTSTELKKKQVLFLQILRINSLPQNIQTIDYPYVSKISQGLNNITYDYWGKIQKDPWEIWHMHSGVYEQTFDLWWLRPLHYWDLPKEFFFGLLIINTSGVIFYGYKTITNKDKLK